MTTLVRALVVAVGFAVAVFTVTPALAQQAPESRTETEARSVFAAGEVAFSDGRYGDALGYFQRAHELSGRPALLFNIALCQDRLRDDEAAIEAYDRYLAEVPLAANRREVDDRLAALRGARTRREAAAQAVQPTHVAQAADAATASNDASASDDRTPVDRGGDGPAVYETWWFWTIVGVVVVGGAVGIGVAASADDPLLPGDLGGVTFTLGSGR